MWFSVQQQGYSIYTIWLLRQAQSSVSRLLWQAWSQLGIISIQVYFKNEMIRQTVKEWTEMSKYLFWLYWWMWPMQGHSFVAFKFVCESSASILVAKTMWLCLALTPPCLFTLNKFSNNGLVFSTCQHIIIKSINYQYYCHNYYRPKNSINTSGSSSHISVSMAIFWALCRFRNVEICVSSYSQMQKHSSLLSICRLKPGCVD